MVSSNPSFILSFQALILPAIILISTSSSYTQAVSQSTERIGTRSLLSFKETPGGGNATFECSPSGPCVPCLYSEKGDEKYRCSETGYRIPLKCLEIEGGAKKTGKKSKKSRSTLENSLDHAKEHSMLLDAEELGTSIKGRRLLDDSSTSDKGRQAYITYRSCIPAVNEEKLSVLGFEGIMFCMVLSAGSFIYFRRRHSVTMAGVVRVQSNSRF